MPLLDAARQHLAENGMTYGQHAAFALRCALLCGAAAVLLAIHAILPCWWQTAGADLTRRLKEHFKT
jgi:hypothetical protein